MNTAPGPTNTVPGLPPDRPYDRLARTATYRWWLPLIELVYFAIAALLLIAVVNAALPDRIDHLIEQGGAAGLIGLSLMFAALIPAAKLAAAASGRGPVGLSSVIGRVRWRWLVRCTVVALVVYAVLIPVDLAIAPQPIAWPGWTTFAPLGLAVLVFIPLQAAGEEYAFRGTLLQTLGAWIPLSWVAVAISSVLFAVVHGLGPAGFVGILGSGLVMGWLAIRTGGLEASIALHAVNNVSGFMLSAAFGASDTWLSQLNQEISWAGAGLGVVFQVIYAAIVVRRCGDIAVRSPGS